MDKSECRAIVARQIGPLSDALGVSWWELTVTYGPVTLGSEPQPEGWARVARCERNAPYNRAYIEIDPEECDDEAAVVGALIHELIHVVLAPLDLYRQFTVGFIDAGSAAEHQENTIFQHTIEQLVVAVERIWRCAPAYWLERDVVMKTPKPKPSRPAPHPAKSAAALKRGAKGKGKKTKP